MDVTGSHEYIGPMGWRGMCPTQPGTHGGQMVPQSSSSSFQAALPVPGLGTLQYSELHLHHASSWELELLYKVPSDSFRDTKHFDQGHTAREGEGLVLGSLLQYCQLMEYQKPFKSCSVI